MHVKSPQLNPCVTRNILNLQRGYSLAFTRCKITEKEKNQNSMGMRTKRRPDQSREGKRKIKDRKNKRSPEQKRKRRAKK